MSRSFAHSLRCATLLACAIAVVPISISPVSAASKTANAAHGYAQRADVRMLIDEMVAGHAFDRRQ
jgi:hypothetical protein